MDTYTQLEPLPAHTTPPPACVPIMPSPSFANAVHFRCRQGPPPLHPDPALLHTQQGLPPLTHRHTCPSHPTLALQPRPAPAPHMTRMLSTRSRCAGSPPPALTYAPSLSIPG